MKEPVKNPQFSGPSYLIFSIFFEKRDCMPKSGSLFVENHGYDSYEPPW
jgi:hypothetical protein